MTHPLPCDTAPTWLAQAPADATAITCDWLFDQGSLTRRLTRLSHDNFSVTPLHEQWQVLRADECQALGLADGSSGWVREVYLRGHGTPWVFARSVAGRQALEADGLALEALGTRSLGELLFTTPAFTRQPIEVCRYPAAWLPADQARDGLWGRRSRFDRGGLRVLVAEVFLPSLWPVAQLDAENP
ncbi:chorismate--pyruvate lyase family protein [Pseudomonas putida]